MERVKFDPAEIKVSALDGALEINYPISRKENMKAILNGKQPLWQPMSNDVKNFAPRLDPDNIARAYVFDGGEAYDKSLFGGKDIFGIEWEFVPVAGGSMVRPGQPMLEDANDWKEFLKVPDINEWDWEGAVELNKEFVKTDMYLSWTFLNGTMNERLISFMDFENAAMALIDEDQKEAVMELMTEICEKVYFPYIENVAKYFPEVDQIRMHDDWGSQRSPFFSLATAREMFVPILQKFSAKCKECGLDFQLHSCGANELVVPAYIEGGVQTWNGMGVINDKRKYYDTWADTGFIFGVDPPAVANDMEASKEDIEAAAKEFCEFLIRDGKTKAIATAGKNPYFNECVYKISREMLNA